MNYSGLMVRGRYDLTPWSNNRTVTPCLMQQCMISCLKRSPGEGHHLVFRLGVSGRRCSDYENLPKRHKRSPVVSYAGLSCTHLIVHGSCLLQELPMRWACHCVESTRIDEDGSPPGTHRHRQLGESHVITDTNAYLAKRTVHDGSGLCRLQAGRGSCGSH